MSTEYVIYGGPMSLFTRKLESACRFYGLPFRTEFKTGPESEESHQRAATHQVPVLRTPENWMIADTTPLLALLDARFPARRMVPAGPAGVLVHVLEEVLDEWVARVMVHFRWHRPENTQYIASQIAGRKLGPEEAHEFPVAQWGRRACRATGTESESQQRAAESEYFGILAALESQLGATPYALGERPTAVDAMLLGGLRAHVNNDPYPDLGDYPRVVAWDEKEADRWDGGGAPIAFSATTPFAGQLLEIARGWYQPFALGNARALEEGSKAFVVESYGEPVSYLARPYPEQSRRMILARIRNQLAENEQRAVGGWLEQQGLDAVFMP